MRTRTLLLLAVSCGLVILIAGGIQLLRLSGRTESTPTIQFGAVGKAGDATVVVTDATDRGTSMTVTVRLAGVDDPDGLDGFTLVAPGVVVQLTPDAPGTCAGFSVEPQTCSLVFDTPTLESGTRVLLFRRADTQLRWTLASG